MSKSLHLCCTGLHKQLLQGIRWVERAKRDNGNVKKGSEQAKMQDKNVNSFLRDRDATTPDTPGVDLAFFWS